MPKGKISFREIAEKHFNKNIWDLFRNEFKDLKNLYDSKKFIEELTKGKLSVSPLTVKNTIKRGLKSGEIKDSEDFVSLSKTPLVKPRGGINKKTSLPVKIEYYIKGNVWDTCKRIFSKSKCLDEAIDALRKESKGKISTSSITLKKLLIKGISEGKLAELYWGKILKVDIKTGKKITKNKSVEKDIEALPSVQVNLQCECGFNVSRGFNVYGDNLDFALKANRCPSCKKFGRFTASGIYNGKPFKKSVFESKKYPGVIMEQFEK